MAGLDFLLNLHANTSGFNQGIDGAKFAVNALVGALAAVGVGLGIKELADAADSYTNLSTQVAIATKEHGNFTEAMAGVQQIALQTNSNLDTTARLFTRLNTVGKEMGLTQQQALDMTRTVTQAIQMGGSSAEEAQSATTQFLQAMQGGVLRGEEFNSIMESGYGLAEALAKGLGRSTSELRGMAEAGELTSERVIEALSTQSKAINDSYSQLPTTIGDAIQRIQTSWQILIGEMDQASGASATVAQWLVYVADNLNIIKTFLDDASDGFVWFGNQLKRVDSSTIDSLKVALTSAYESFKSLLGTVGTTFSAVVDIVDTVLSKVFSFTDAWRPAGEQVSGFQKVLDLLNVGLGILGDGFNVIGIGVNLFVGALYKMGVAFEHVRSMVTWGGVKQEALANMAEMQAKADEHFQKAQDGAMSFESQSIKALENIGKTQEQKNQERIADNEATLAKLLEQEQAHKDSYKSISDERIKLEQALSDARKSGDQSAADQALANISSLEKREQEWSKQSQDITKAKIDAAQALLDATLQNAAEKAEKLKLATEAVKKADEEYLSHYASMASQKEALEKRIEDAKKTGDLNALKSAQDAIEAINVKDADLFNVRKARIDELNALQKGNASDSEKAYSKASEAAQKLGINIDQALNRVSEKFKESSDALDSYIKHFPELGVAGERAAEITYQAWQKWLETAKSQAEIDLAKQKLIEFGQTGQLSTEQVRLGMEAIKQVTRELPAELTEVEKAFERLGIKTKEQLKLSAELALNDFETVKRSGQATQADLQSAYERTVKLAHASGDAQTIAMANAKAASLGLEVQISETGDVSVKTFDEMSRAAESHGQRVRDHVGGAYRDTGRIAREEAKSTTEAWNDALTAQQEASKKAKEAGKLDGPKGGEVNSSSLADIESRLKSYGYDDKQAKKFAQSIFAEGMTVDRNMMQQNAAKANGRYTNQAYQSLHDQGLTSNFGTAKINELLTKYAQGIGTSSTGKTINYNLNLGGKTVSLSGPANQESAVDQMLSELEMLSKRS